MKTIHMSHHHSSLAKVAKIPKPLDLGYLFKTLIQDIHNSLLLFHGYRRDTAVPKALNSYSQQQSKPITTTINHIKHLLLYFCISPCTRIRYRSSTIILQIHSNALYLSEPIHIVQLEVSFSLDCTYMLTN